jgi:MFS family permease
MKISTKKRYLVLSFGSWLFAGFDFILLPVFAFIFGKIFFPDPNPIFTILAIYGTLSLSLLGRVVGGLFFGRLSDLYGRRPVILITSLFLAISMIIFGYILPFLYVHHVSQHANTMINFVLIPPMIFVLLRIAIGFLIGGVWPTAGTLATENIFQNYKYRYTMHCINSEGKVENQRRIQRASEYLHPIINTAKLDESKVLKAFNNMDSILEKLFDELSAIDKIDLDKKIKLKKYSYDLVKDIVIIKEEILRTAKLKAPKLRTSKLEEIIELSAQLKNELEKLSEDAVFKQNYDLSNLIINIKEIEKLIYIEKLRVLELVTKGSPYKLEKIKKLRKYDRMEKLTWQSGIIQFGFSLGLLLAALIGAYFQNNFLNKFLLDMLQNLYLYVGFVGLLWFVILYIFLEESVILKYEMRKSKNLKKYIGIRELLENEKTRTTLFNFWLIMTGLMYLYYSTIIIAPDILHRNEIINWNIPGFLNTSIIAHLGISKYMTLSTQFAIISIIAHLGIPILCYFLWNNKSHHDLIFKNNIFNKIYNAVFRIYHIVKVIPTENKKSNISNYTFKSEENINQDKQSSLDEIENVDVKLLIFLGMVLILLGIIVFCVYWLLPPDGKAHGHDLIILIIMLVIFFGNAGFGLIPSMLASRFPIHLRNIGSSLAYNGGLVIGFASPFISMEFYLFVKSDYLLSVPIVLGAISIIIGSIRLLKKQNSKIKPKEKEEPMKDNQ